MGYRTESFSPTHIYHLCHRGIGQQDIFRDDRDKLRFKELLTYYLPREAVMSFSLFRAGRGSTEKRTHSPVHSGSGLVDLLCYCFMNNHVHLLLKENVERGISRYAQRIFNSYARYFNTRYRRSGGLFTGRFKSVLVDGDEQFLHVTRYIHLNPFVSGITSTPLRYPWSSLSEYIPGSSSGICHTSLLMSMTKPIKYKEFVTDFADYARELATIKHLTLEL